MDDQQTNQDNELQKRIADLEKQTAELENNWKRALADYRNLQKRTEEEKESLVDFINGALFRRIIPVLDNLEMLQKHMDDIGLKMIVKEFKQIMSDEGLVEIEAQDKDFDPQTMEAIETVEGPDNKVVEILNKGYMFKKVGADAPKLLRPARVKVGKLKEDKAQE